MLKSQDVVILLKILSNKKYRNFKQKQLAKEVCLSSSTINESLNRLHEHNLLIKNRLYTITFEKEKYVPIVQNDIEFLTKVVKYIWPNTCKALPLTKKFIHPCVEKIFTNTKVDFSQAVFYNLILTLDKIRIQDLSPDSPDSREKVENYFIKKIIENEFIQKIQKINE